MTSDDEELTKTTFISLTISCLLIMRKSGMAKHP